MSKILIIFIFLLLYLTVSIFIYGGHFAFYAYELIYFFNPDNRWWSYALPRLPYSFLYVLMMIIFLIVSKYKSKSLNLFELPNAKWLILFLASFALTEFYAINEILNQRFLIDFLKMIFTLVIAFKLLDTDQKLNYAIYFFLLGCAYIGYEAFVTGRDEFGRVEDIGMVDAPGANGTAAALVPALPFLIYFFWFGNKKIKFLMIIFGALTLNGIVLINSRGAFLGAVFAISYFMWELYRSKFKVKYQKIIVVLFFLLGSIALLNIVDDSFVDRMNTLTEVEDESKSGSHRYRFWLLTFDLLSDYPFGVGAFGYETLSPSFIPEYLFDRGKNTKAVHSIWFQALSEVGWHGGIFFFILIYITYKMTKKVKQHYLKLNMNKEYYFTHALQSSFLALLITSSFINQLRVQIIYWMILFISCNYGISGINNKQQKS